MCDIFKVAFSMEGLSCFLSVLISASAIAVLAWLIISRIKASVTAQCVAYSLADKRIYIVVCVAACVSF